MRHTTGLGVESCPGGNGFVAAALARCHSPKYQVPDITMAELRLSRCVCAWIVVLAGMLRRMVCRPLVSSDHPEVRSCEFQPHPKCRAAGADGFLGL